MDYQTVTDNSDVIGFYEKYNKWAIYTDVETSDNIDTRIVGLVCGLAETFQTDGLNVIYSGTYYEFNPDENITPQTGGEKLYFLSISEIKE